MSGDTGALGGLYTFVRKHLLIANNVVLASITVVGALDFMAPRLAIAPLIVYSATASLLALMVVVAAAPAATGRVFATLGLDTRRRDGVAMWRHPVWQFVVVILTGVSVVGFASVAKADRGGLIASSFPSAKTAQDALFGVRQDVADIRTGVARANSKLDSIAAVVDPDQAADRCADLNCALQGGASVKAVKRLFEKGVTVPGDRINRGELLREAAMSHGSDRLEIIDLLVQKGIDRDTPFLPMMYDETSLTRIGARLTRDVYDASRLQDSDLHRFGNPLSTGHANVDVWNDVIGCVWRTSSANLRLIDLAVLLGDGDLYGYAVRGGSRLAEQPLACRWGGARKSGAARIDIDRATGAVLRVTAG